MIARHRRRQRRGILAGLVSLSLVGGVSLVLLRRRWALVTVQGNSMTPTLHDGQRLLACRSRTPPRRGEVIVFSAPRRGEGGGQRLDPPYRVKRAVAVAGDPTPAWMCDAAGTDRPRLVPPGFFVVAGDNLRSQDSRHLGYISADAVIGVVDPHRFRLVGGRASVPMDEEGQR